MLRICKSKPNRLFQLRSFSKFNFDDSEKLPANTVIKFVPQQEAWIVERMGKYNQTLEGGLAILIPFIDSIAYVHSLKEVTVSIPSQSAITGDNVTLSIDGVLYYKVFDAYKASYGIDNAEYAITQLAQTTMRAEIGRLTLDKTLAERAALNLRIVEAMNTAANEWGIKILRYEIKDIHPPSNVVESMHRQVSAERKKRAEILESEGSRQSAINIAEGSKQSQILESEAIKQRQINIAKGEAEAILARAAGTAEALKTVSSVLKESGASGDSAVTLALAEKYIEAFSNLAKESNTVIVPSNVADASGMLTQMMSVIKGIQKPQ